MADFDITQIVYSRSPIDLRTATGVCSHCGAIVASRGEELHTAWHEWMMHTSAAVSAIATYFEDLKTETTKQELLKMVRSMDVNEP